MHISVVTLFPEWFASPLSAALLGRAQASGLVDFTLLNPRDEAESRHLTVDDRPYGGGPGMVMMLDPLLKTLRKLKAEGDPPGRVLVLSASGRPFTQVMARELAIEERLTLVCGRYEGIDGRLGELVPVEYVSVGDAVLNGGESAAMMLIEATTRLIPGFMGKEASGEDESFSAGLLEYPHYTRPEVCEGVHVPEVLLSGDHARIAAWRRERSLLTTWNVRPDMLDEAPLNDADLVFLRSVPRERLGRNLHCALVHYPVFLGDKKTGATSLTNLDIHDIARCSRTYGLSSFTVVTPLKDQQSILDTLVRHWTEGQGALSNPDRAEAFRLVRRADSVQDTVGWLTAHTGQEPFLVATSARDNGSEVCRLTPQAVRSLLHERPVLLLFGTGHGMAPDLLEACHGVLRPLRWMDTYNHLPVRGAVAITLDRVLGDSC